MLCAHADECITTAGGSTAHPGRLSLCWGTHHPTVLERCPICYLIGRARSLPHEALLVSPVACSLLRLGPWPGELDPPWKQDEMARGRAPACAQLTEQWQASICLFHRRLGGVPLPVQFANGRRGAPLARSHTQGEPMMSLMKSWANDSGAAPALLGQAHAYMHSQLHDEWDELLYHEARRRFEHDLLEARSRDHASRRQDAARATPERS